MKYSEYPIENNYICFYFFDFRKFQLYNYPQPDLSGALPAARFCCREAGTEGGKAALKKQIEY